MRERDEVQRHYAELLAPVYVWMLGGAAEALARARSWVAEQRLARFVPGLAVDLGCGPGFHAIALAEAGFETLAIDSSPELLARIEDPRVRKQAGDLLEFEEALHGAEPRVVLCLGDTLTHLHSEAQVDELLDACVRSLAAGGLLALSFRDYSVLRKPSECLIRVREDALRSLSCALEFEQERVRVTDILHEWRGGRWVESSSSYSKLRLAPEALRANLLARGFVLEHDELARGVASFVALSP